MPLRIDDVVIGIHKSVHEQIQIFKEVFVHFHGLYYNFQGVRQLIVKAKYFHRELCTFR